MQIRVPILLLASVLAARSVHADRYTEIYNLRLWGQVAFGSYSAPTGLTLAATTGGAYTNAGVTNAFTYRLYGTNSQGRTAIATGAVVFSESTGASAVAIGWARLDGVSGYVLEKSYDSGVNWTNHLHLAASATNATDWQPSTFSDGSNAVSAIPAATYPWLTNEAAFSAWLETNEYVRSNSGDWAGTWQGIGTGDVVLTETDPHFTTSVAARVAVGDTSLWHQAAADASSATASVAAAQADITTLQGRTSTWDQAAADASSSTSSIASIQSATNALNARGLVQDWSDYDAKGLIEISGPLTTNLIVTGGSVDGAYSYAGIIVGKPAWTNADGVGVTWDSSSSYYIGIGGAPENVYFNNQEYPTGVYASALGTYTGTPTVAYSIVGDGSAWKYGVDPAQAALTFEVTRDGTNLFRVGQTNVTLADGVGMTLGGETRTNWPGADYLPLAGGTMSGAIATGTNAITVGTNAIEFYGGVLDNTNGVYFRSNGTNYWILLP